MVPALAGKTATTLALLALVLLTLGCRETVPPDNSSPPSTAATPNQAACSGLHRFETEGRAAGETASPPQLTLPQDFPSAVPLLPDRRIVSFSPRENGSVSLTFSVSKSRRETAVFYREQLTASGWEFTLDSASGGMTTLSARREDGSRMTVNIIAKPSDQLTMVGLYFRPPAGFADEAGPG